MKQKFYDGVLSGLYILCGIAAGVFCIAMSLAAMYLMSGCTNAVLEGPDGATEDVGVAVEPLLFTFVNSNNGQPLNDSSCKLAYLRGFAMQECTVANCWTCSGDTCSKSPGFSEPNRKWVAKSCVDLDANENRRCELRVQDLPTVNTLKGYMFYNGLCQHAPLPKASLLYPNTTKTLPPTQRVLNQPTNQLETF